MFVSRPLKIEPPLFAQERFQTWLSAPSPESVIFLIIRRKHVAKKKTKNLLITNPTMIKLQDKRDFRFDNIYRSIRRDKFKNHLFQIRYSFLSVYVSNVFICEFIQHNRYYLPRNVILGAYIQNQQTCNCTVLCALTFLKRNEQSKIRETIRKDSRKFLELVELLGSGRFS